MANGGSSADKVGAIATFVSVAESASFTAAAKKLRITVSGVSRAITRLEEHLNVRLLHRTSRAVSLTSEGSLFFERCKQILLDLEEAEHEVTSAKSQVRGQVRIQLPRALGKQIVVPALAKFCEQFPDIRVDVILDGRSFNLDEEGIDVALRYGIPADSPLIGRKLCPVFYVACASPGYIRHYGMPQSLEELRQHRLIGHVIAQQGTYRTWNFDTDGDQKSMSMPSVMTINDMSSTADAAISGAGIAYLADFVAAEHLACGRLQTVLPGHICEGQPIYMTYPWRKHVSPRSRVLREFMTTIIPPSPTWSVIVQAHRGNWP
jgi:LysR family transcriptional regulator for bpeEF and oprC